MGDLDYLLRLVLVDADELYLVGRLGAALPLLPVIGSGLRDLLLSTGEPSSHNGILTLRLVLPAEHIPVDVLV